MTILAWSLLLLGGSICVNNWRTLNHNLASTARGEGRHVSMVPLAGPLGLLAGLGYLLPQPDGWLLLVVLLDVWSWMLILWGWQRLFDRD